MGPTKPSNQPASATSETDEKLPYEPPAVISEEVFETLALSCGKGTGPCGPPSSGNS